MEKQPKTMEDFYQEEVERIKGVTIDSATKRYKKFKNGKLAKMDLLALDFRPTSPKSILNNERLHLVLASDIYMTIPYEEIYEPMVNIFSQDIIDYGIETTYDSKSPEEKTGALRIFAKQNPEQLIDYGKLTHHLNIPEAATIEIVRYYLNIQDYLPLSEVWTATRLGS